MKLREIIKECLTTIKRFITTRFNEKIDFIVIDISEFNISISHVRPELRMKDNQTMIWFNHIAIHSIKCNVRSLNLDSIVDKNWLRNKIADILVEEIDENFEIWFSYGFKIGIISKTSRTYRIFLQYIGGWLGIEKRM